MRLNFLALGVMILLFSFQKTVAQSSSPILITEINYNSDSTMNPGNWVELYNKSASAVDVSGWMVKNSLTISYTLPSGTQMNAGAYLVVYQDQVKFNALFPGVTNKVGPSNVDFSNTADNVQLFNAANNLMINVAYQDTGTWPKGADGWGRTLELNDYNGNVNDGHNWFDGCMLGSPGVAYTPCNPDIVFSEINYNSSLIKDAGDWLELHNTTASPISLNGYTLKDSKDSNIFYFPAGLTLAPNGYREVVQDVAKFLNRHPSITNFNGPFPFGFKSKGEAIRLFGADGKLKFSVLYDNKAPWPITPDSGGYTLELLDIHGKMDNAENWFAGCPEGSPGWPYASGCNAAVNDLFANNFQFALLNVTDEMLTVTVSGIQNSQAAEISLVNLVGQKVFQSAVTNGTNELNISHLPTGIYLAEINFKGEVHSLKFIKY
ncbi:MAG: lamin tail domain-containing protein [Bacteroidota bacterium]